MRANGKRIVRVRPLSWSPVDDKRLRNAVCVGRREVELDDGSRFGALAFASTDPKTLGQKFIAWLEWRDDVGGRVQHVVCYELIEDAEVRMGGVH